MKVQLFVIFLAFTQFFLAQKPTQKGQNINSNKVLDDFGRERVYLHMNSSLFLVGEYLYYSFYCLNENSNRLSTLSKIGYVELLGEDGSVVFKHKVALEKGVGSSDFFIPTSVLSGNYKIVGYTRWMMNWGGVNAFQSDITIINPYNSNQQVFREKKEQDDFKEIPSTSSIPTDFKRSSSENTHEMLLEKIDYGKREKVSVTLRCKSSSNLADFISGSFSFSARKLDSLERNRLLTPISFKKSIKTLNLPVTSQEETFIVPELRGGLISGNIIPTELNLPVKNQKVLFSTPGQQYDVRVLSTNEDGHFNFSIDHEIAGEKAIFQILGNNRKNFKISIDSAISRPKLNLRFNRFAIDSSMKGSILRRSIHNQIENAYYDNKKDTVKIDGAWTPFYGEALISYNLDEYERFKTIEETVVEIIENVWVSMDSEGKPYFEIRGLYQDESKDAYRPLVIVDGLILQEYEKLIRYDSREVETVNVIRDKYVLGSQIFQGILEFKTYEGNYHENELPPFSKMVNLAKPRENKLYFNQSYQEPGRFDQIPDYRNQLIWIPRLDLSSNNNVVSFYTSDVTGPFEITLEGFTKKGTAIYLRKVINVE